MELLKIETGIEWIKIINILHEGFYFFFFVYELCLFRSALEPTGVGSYVMDALSMALHIVTYSSTFKEAILKAVNLGGDADTLGAIVGMIAGAFYGFN